MFEVGTAGRMQRTVNNCTVLCQKLAPVGEELRIVVLARKMGLQARPEVDMHSVRILSRWQGSTLRFCRRKRSRLPLSLHGYSKSGQQDENGRERKKQIADVPPI